MVAVCIIGVLASVAIPAFSSYMMNARGAEVPTNLSAMYKGASAYWESGLAGRGTGTTTSGHCAVDEGATGRMMFPEFPPVPERRPGGWDDSHTFRAIGFAPADPVYGCYVLIFNKEIDDPPCGMGHADFSNSIIYIALGATDLDGDGRVGGYSLQIALHDDDTMYRQPGFGAVADGLAVWDGWGGAACPFCADGFVD